MGMLSEALERNLETVQDQAQGKTDGFSFVMVGPNAPSPKQVDFYKVLVNGKVMDEEYRENLKKGLQYVNKKSMVHVIEGLVRLPWMPRPKPVPVVSSQAPASPVAKIGEGRYAVTLSNGELGFFEVRKPTEGKWAGFVFLSQLSGDNKFSIRDKAERESIYALIAQDVMGALKLYGQKIGRCGHCRKTLTDEVSREFGIGPVCRKVLGV